MRPESAGPEEANFAIRHADRERERHPHHSGGGGYSHWIRTAGTLAPLIIGEVVKDPDKRWRYIRIASVAMALVSEGLYAHKVHHERKEHGRDRER